MIGSKKAFFVGASLAVGVLGFAHFIGSRPLRRHLSALPEAIARVARKHVPPDDFKAFDRAVLAHVQAGRPLTRAAMMALANIHIAPADLDAVRAELQAKGLI
jgi:hypothetical protein